MAEMTVFSGMYLKWKRRAGVVPKREDAGKETILKRSIDEEAIANDLVMCSQMDSYMGTGGGGLSCRTTCIHRLANT